MRKNSMKTKVVAVLMASALVVTSSPVEASAAAKISWKSAKSSMKEGKTATFKVKNAPKAYLAKLKLSQPIVEIHSSLDKKSGIIIRQKKYRDDA